MIFDGLVKNVNNKGEGSDTPTEPHHTPSPEAQPPSHTTHSSSSLPSVTTTIPAPASPLRDVSQGEACPTDSGFIADQDRVTIAKSSTLPHDSAPRVTSPAADEGSIQQTISELTALCTSLQRQHSELLAKFQAQEVEINRSLDEGEAAAERICDDSEEMATVLTSMDAATVLAGGIADVPTGIFATATVVTPYRRRKGKEVMVESETPKKQRVQEKIDAQKKFMLKPFKSNIPLLTRRFTMRDRGATGRLQGWEAAQPYQFFIYLLKPLDREDLNQLWRLVNETLSNRPPTSDKEMELWVELSRLYEPDHEDQLWTHTQNLMHAPIEWKLYNSCGVHHVTSKDKEIFMLVEKDYPLRKGLALVMISYKLQVENYSQMANDLILKIYKIANFPRQQGD
nr:hypothetical protein [Tanacetum cinerariifolium]